MIDVVWVFLFLNEASKSTLLSCQWVKCGDQVHEGSGRGVTRSLCPPTNPSEYSTFLSLLENRRWWGGHLHRQSICAPEGMTVPYDEVARLLVLQD